MNPANCLGYTIFAALAIWLTAAVIFDKFPRRTILVVIVMAYGATIASCLVSL